MNKVRNCKFQNLKVYTKKNNQRVHYITDFEFHDPVPTLASRASINQAWGPWTIFIKTPYKEADISMFASHSCHKFYDSTSMIHDFSVVRSDDGELMLTQ